MRAGRQLCLPVIIATSVRVTFARLLERRGRRIGASVRLTSLRSHCLRTRMLALVIDLLASGQTRLELVRGAHFESTKLFPSRTWWRPARATDNNGAERRECAACLLAGDESERRVNRTWRLDNSSESTGAGPESASGQVWSRLAAPRRLEWVDHQSCILGSQNH